MENDDDDVLVMVAKAAAKAKEAYYEELQDLNVDGAYYPIRISVMETDNNFKPVRTLLVTCDAEELTKEGASE